jgi:putative ABC transport system permease protein
MLLGRKQADEELNRELLFHLERQLAENVAAGMSAEEARRAALRAFGNPALLREQARATWSWNGLDSMLRDVRYGFRTLRRTPGFSFIAILVMALGIGANVALFTVVRNVLLKPLPYVQPNRLVSLFEGESKRKGSDFMPVDAGSFSLWQRAASGVAEMAMVSSFQSYNVSAEGGKLPETIDAAWCSWNFFRILGVEPSMGRNFMAEDDRPGAPATVILGYSFWKRRYGGDASMVGKAVWLNAKPYTVIGILPASFAYVDSIGNTNMQVWTPVNHEAPPSLLTAFDDHEFIVVARLLGNATLPRLVEQLDAVQRQIEASHREPAVHDAAEGRYMLEDAVHDYKTPLYALLAATGCVLLIACMNVASLLVARNAARSKEIAIRSALGGGRLRLLRERILESLLLSMCGGAVGVSLAYVALRWLVHARPDMHRVEAIHMDGVVAAFTVGVVVLCALFSGVISAMSSGGKHTLNALQEGSRGNSGGTSRANLRKGLLVLEVSFTVVLLVGAGLLLKSFQKLRSVDLGVPADNVLTMRVSLPDARYAQPAQRISFFEHLIERVRAVPGVSAAGLVSTAPGEGWGGDHMMKVVEHPPLPKGQMPDFLVRGAEPGYFSAIGIPLLHGRIFTSDERLTRDHVVVISKSAADKIFPGEDPVGRHLQVEATGDIFQIIGVVGDTRYSVTEPLKFTLYWPLYGNDYSSATVVVRAAQDVEALAIPVQKIIGALDHDLPVSDVLTLREAIGKSTIDSAFDSLLVMAFAVIALILAAAGLYGVLAYLVTQRTSEIGIRIALGAPRPLVMRTMLLDGLRPALFGLALGIAGSAVAARLIRSMLYETQPLDSAVFAGVAAMLLLVAAAACVVPAWRASRLDPMQALRTE